MTDLALLGAALVASFVCVFRWRTATTYAAGVACLAVGALEGRGAVLFAGVVLLTLAMSDLAG